MLRPGETDFELWLPSTDCTLRIWELDGPLKVSANVKSTPVRVALMPRQMPELFLELRARVAGGPYTFQALARFFCVARLLENPHGDRPGAGVAGPGLFHFDDQRLTRLACSREVALPA